MLGQVGSSDSYHPTFLYGFDNDCRLISETYSGCLTCQSSSYKRTWKYDNKGGVCEMQALDKIRIDPSIDDERISPFEGGRNILLKIYHDDAGFISKVEQYVDGELMVGIYRKL